MSTTPAAAATRPERLAYAGGIATRPVLSLVFGLSQTQALVILFIVVPIAAAAVIVPVAVWWLSRGPGPVRTSEILAEGTPAQAEILRVRSLGNVLDLKPMVRFSVRVAGGPGEEPFDLDVVQAVPRTMLGLFRPGDVVRVRLSADRTVGAIEWGYEPPGT
jgi:hypothetical protein